MNTTTTTPGQSRGTAGTQARKLAHCAYRASSKRYHPDTGGAADLFRRVKEAEAMLLEFIGGK